MSAETNFWKMQKKKTSSKFPNILSQEELKDYLYWNMGKKKAITFEKKCDAFMSILFQKPPSSENIT